MNSGASFVVGKRDIARLANRDDKAMVWVGRVGQQLDHDASDVFDVTACGERYLGLYMSDVERLMVEVQFGADRSIEVGMVRSCPSRGAKRVAMTAERWYVASDGEVHALAGRTAGFELLSVDAIDIAASPELVCVLDDRGVAWFDARNALVARRSLASPTALAWDDLAKGWLVVDAGDVVQVASPTAEAVVLARGVGLATRVRRDRDALYVASNGELLEVVGVRQGPTTSAPNAIASYAVGWQEFDAYWELFVDDGDGPKPFFADLDCRCRVRHYEVVDRWTQRTGDGGYDHHERQRCPRCGHTWERIYGQ